MSIAMTREEWEEFCGDRERETARWKSVAAALSFSLADYVSNDPEPLAHATAALEFYAALVEAEAD